MPTLSRAPVGGCQGEDGEPEVVVAVIEDDGEAGRDHR